MSNDWSDSVWGCFSPPKACLMSWCCPCMVYGQQSERLEDPALKEGSLVNGDCCLFVLANYCCLHWVLMMMKRRDMREKFGVKGSVGKDCILSCLCTCCVLVQQEKELDAQAKRFQTASGYQPPAAMSYPPSGPGDKQANELKGNGVSTEPAYAVGETPGLPPQGAQVTGTTYVADAGYAQGAGPTYPPAPGFPEKK